MPNDNRWWRAGILLAGAFLIVCCLFYWKISLRKISLRPQPVESAEPWIDFSGEKALAHVRALVDLGARPPASPAIQRARLYITRELRNCHWLVEEQAFEEETPRGKVRFVNLIATHGDLGKKAAGFVVCSHYDTKTFDTINFVGANDGGSSTGALIEMARVLDLHPALANQVELVFFDGEEAYVQF